MHDRRAKLRLSRGLPRCLAYDVIPCKICRPIGKGFHKGSHRKAGSRGKPRFGRSLTLPTRGRLANDVMPYKLVGQSAKISYGVISQGRMTRKAPVRTEPHPTNPRSTRQRRYALQIGRPIGKNFIWGHIARQDDPESPGSDRASPYLRPKPNYDFLTCSESCFSASSQSSSA